MKKLVEKQKRRARRKLRIRGRLSGSAECPRLTVFRSNRHVYVQAIDDASGTTVASASSMNGESKGTPATATGAAKIGEAIAKLLLVQNVSRVVFDRNGYLYHGVVKSLAEGARKAGLKF